jgi:hypothetical protein
MGIVGATTDSFILFENGVTRNRLVLPGLSNAADHMPSKPPTAPAAPNRRSAGICINSMTHLSLKDARTDTDHEFIGLVNDMQIRSANLSPIAVSHDFSVEEIDRFHELYRKNRP